MNKTDIHELWPSRPSMVTSTIIAGTSLTTAIPHKCVKMERNRNNKKAAIVVKETKARAKLDEVAKAAADQAKVAQARRTSFRCATCECAFLRTFNRDAHQLRCKGKDTKSSKVLPT